MSEETQFVTEEEQKARLEICYSCDKLEPMSPPEKMLHMCTECGCSVVNKSLFKNKSCPLGKW
jgi:hypothetical protein